MHSQHKKWPKLKGRLIHIFMSIGLGLLLAGCSNQVPKLNLDVDLEVNPSIKGEHIKLDYVTAYTIIAKGIRLCWLADKKPLQKSQFFARTKNHGPKKQSDLFIHGPAVHPKRGPRIVSVHLQPQTGGSEIRVDNRLLDPINEAHFNNDIRYWIKGGKDCPEHKNKNEITPKPVEKTIIKQKKKTS